MNKKVLLASAILTVTALSGCDGFTPAPVGELNTPQYSIQSASDVDFDEIASEEVHIASEGVVQIVPKSARTNPACDTPTADNVPILIGETPDSLWQNDTTVTYNAFTLPEKAMLNKEGVVGILSIPAIDLCMNVYEAADGMEAMLHGGAHYKETSCYDGNVGISAHVSGVPDAVSFSNLHLLQPGDAVTYQTAIGTRNYRVTEVREIADDDWSWLARTPDNRITLTTCITGQPSMRLMVQALQIQ